jgi:AmiR/NasT family two-component response regulator
LDFFDATPDGSPSPGLPLGTQLQHSVLELVQAQAQRLQAMSAELDTTRASLNERKLVERAKGLLMAQRQLSEAQAHKTLRQLAMNQNRRLVDVAEAVLALADLTTGTVHPHTDAATHK